MSIKRYKKIAVIREEECIGCTKCIDACPVDAIIGSAKLMHTVIAAECIGCERCIAPCPIDCIDLIHTDQPYQLNVESKALAQHRYAARKKRLAFMKSQQPLIGSAIENKKHYLEAALQRARLKKEKGC